MSAIATAIVGGSIVSGYLGSEAAGDAADAQSASAAQGIGEQRRQFNALQELLKPYSEAGVGALGQQQALIGLSGAEAQQKALADIQSSPAFAAMQQQGENAILQNASATGGLRGGNVQGALAQFRPQILNALVDQQYQRLGGLTSIGQNAAAGVGNAGMATGQGISALLQQQGAAQAGAALAGGRAAQGIVGGIQSGLGSYIGGGGSFGGNGGLGTASQGNAIYDAGGYSGTAGTGF